MPAYGNFILDKGYDAAAALTKYRFVKFSAEETVTPVTAIADLAIGVAQFDVSAAEINKGKGASVRLEGISEVEVGATTVVVGNEVQLTANGQVIPAVGSSGARVVGVAVKGAVNGARAAIRIALPGRIA